MIDPPDVTTAPQDAAPGQPGRDAGTPATASASASPAAAGSPRSDRAAPGLGAEVLAWMKTLASATGWALLIVTFVGQLARVQGHSMEPTLHDQDRLVINKLAYLLHAPQAGDIVMHYYPLDPRQTFVKRVIAVPGDTVEIRDGRVYRNGHLVPDEYVADGMRSHDDLPRQTVPDGHYFVLGDHRSDSSDSRAWGFVPERYIVGKIELRWWPLDAARLFER
ncbi:MAG: signal peptidase I [Vicinamibacterales bacterium]